MNLSVTFIKRPIATTLLALGLALAGLLAFNLLPVAPLPQIDFPTITVQAQLPGASPEVMATSVATPLERQLGRIAGISQITSTSTLGQMNIIVQFDLSRNIDGAARDVQAAINASLSQLPPNLINNPVYRKVNPADAPIMILALTSDKYTTGEMYDVASTLLQQRILRIEGIGQVNVSGSSLPAVRVELNPTTLSKYKIGLDEVATLLQHANINQAKGQINHINGTTSLIKNNDQLFKAAQYAPLIIKYQDKSPVRLSDIGTVVDSVADLRNAGFADGKPAVLLVLFKQPGANVIKTVDYVKKILPQLKASIPNAIQLTTLLDRTATIRTSLHDVELTLLIAIALVILTSYLFLGSVRAMIIAGIAVPLSLLGSFVLMYLLGFSLNNLSLMALTISTGFVIDDAVVVLENISRHLAMGKSAMQAAVDGVKEIGFTVVAMSLSLIAVFIPIFLMGGIVGRLFHEFVMVLSIAILISLVVSLTVTPMMCAQLLGRKNKIHQHVFMRFIERIRQHYAHTLKWVVAHPFSMLLVTFITLFFTAYLFIVVPKGFFPQQDTERIAASLQADQNISFQALQKKMAHIIKIVRKDPAVLHVAAFMGSGGPGGNTSNTGSVFIMLKPGTASQGSTNAVLDRLRIALKKVKGVQIYMQLPQDVTIGGRLNKAQFQYTLSEPNLTELNYWAPKIMAELAKIPGLVDLNSDQLSQGLQLYVEVDHDTASRFGITSQQIDATLYSAFGQRQVSVLYMPMNQYFVVMEVAPQYWQYPETLKEIYVRSPTGQAVPLAAFARFAPSSTLLSVNHQSQAPAATLSFNLVPGKALGGVVNKINETVHKMKLPPALTGSFQGTAQAFEQSLANESYLILGALLAVYIVLGILYESLIHPVTILSTLPSAGLGALLALLLCRTDLNLIALIGIILLIGIVKKNAIMMIDFALHATRMEGKTAKEAIYEAALLRFRPIIMTTAAALLGAVPLVIGFGLGAELRRPLGIAIVGGLLVSQFLTLYTTPVIYLAMERLTYASKSWLAKFKGKKSRIYGS